jgi:hypothetical protein
MMGAKLCISCVEMVRTVSHKVWDYKRDAGLNCCSNDAVLGYTSRSRRCTLGVRVNVCEGVSGVVSMRA